MHNQRNRNKERALVMGLRPNAFLLIYKVEYQLFVYQMGRLCGGAHDILGIKAPIFLHGWVVYWGGGVGGGGVGVVRWGWWGGWVLEQWVGIAPMMPPLLFF